MGTTNKTLSTTVAAAADADNVFCMRNRVSLVGLATGEVVQCLSVPAGTLVLWVLTRVVTPETCGVSTATVGDGAGANSWDASVSFGTGTTAGDVAASVAGTDTYATTGKLYSTADTIDITITVAGGPCVSGVVEVMALCVKFPPIAGSL